jgi:hypothetical protein
MGSICDPRASDPEGKVSVTSASGSMAFLNRSRRRRASSTAAGSALTAVWCCSKAVLSSTIPSLRLPCSVGQRPRVADGCDITLTSSLLLKEDTTCLDGGHE